MARGETTAIGQVFYETRALQGRDATLRRFAAEQLDGTVDETMLGYIEKGRRFPNEALVRRLAAIRNEQPDELLALLWRDRMVYAFGRELKRVIKTPRGLAGTDVAEVAVVLSQAVAALPEDGSWVGLAAWRKRYGESSSRSAGVDAPTSDVQARVEKILREQELVEQKGRRVRLRSRDYVASGDEERYALALEFCELFAKSLLDKLALPEHETGTYVRNHFANIDPSELPEIQAEIDRAIADIVRRYDRASGTDRRFLNVLINSTTI